MSTHWKVDVSFYVPMEVAYSTTAAWKLVQDELNSAPVQKLVGDTIGAADVHIEDVIEWDMEA